MSQTLSYPGTKCGCVVPVVHVRTAVYDSVDLREFCNELGESGGPPFRTKKQKRVPLITEIHPYHYLSPNVCPGCPARNPGLQSDPGNDHANPPTLNPRPPSRDPITIIRPWNPETDGPVPGIAGAAVDPSRKPEIEVDLTEFFATRRIESTLDLNLFEMRFVVSQLRDANSIPPLAGLSDSPATILMSKGKLMSSGMRLDGTAGSLEKKIRAMAKGMIKSPDYGDFNQNGTRDADDLILLQNALARDDLKMDELRMFDIDGDGFVTPNDIRFWLGL